MNSSALSHKFLASQSPTHGLRQGALHSLELDTPVLRSRALPHIPSSHAER